MATTSLVSIEDYLQNTSFKPGVEYIDGDLTSLAKDPTSPELAGTAICAGYKLR